MLPYILCAAASILAAALSVKLLLLKKDIDEIWQELGERLSDETNTLLSVSSRDKHIIALASKLNAQLRLLRAQRREYARRLPRRKKIHFYHPKPLGAFKPADRRAVLLLRHADERRRPMP